MAEGVRTRLGADLGLATTGVAGPGGEHPKSPSGWSISAWRRRKAPRRAGSTSARTSRATSSSAGRPRPPSTGCGLTLLENR